MTIRVPIESVVAEAAFSGGTEVGTSAVPMSLTQYGERGVDQKRTKLGVFGPLLFGANLAWSSATGASGVLLQALFAEIAPHDKISLYATMGTIAAIAATIAGITAGALSDRTRSRWGARLPWILMGGLVAPVALASTGLALSPSLIIAGFIVYQVAQSAMLAALMALTPDFLDRSILARASAVSGAGLLTGQICSGAIGAFFVTMPMTGLKIVPWGMAIAVIAIALFLPASSNRDVPAGPPLSLLALLRSFMPPMDREFWWAFVGRFFFIMSFAMTIMYQFYILTDYDKLSTQAAGNVLAIAAAIFAVGAAIFTIGAAHLSDRLRRRKPFVIGASIATALATVPLVYVSAPWALLFFCGVAGCAFGTYISVDQALMVEVLPDESSAARDLSFLGASNSLPFAFAPAVAGVLTASLGYTGMFYAAIAAALIGAACIFGIHRVR